MSFFVRQAAVRAARRTAVPFVHLYRMESTWQPALKSGVLPVYDEALAFLEEDAKQLRERIASEKANSNASDKEQQQRVDALEIVSEINLPATRWAFQQGQYSMTKPVFRHLREQSWRLGGSLDRLEERLQCMHVLPDVVPSVQPTVDLEVLFGTGNGIGDHGGEGGSILPGVFLDPARTLEPPSIRATVFHPDERKYTLMLVDPDVPCEETQSFQTYVHWLVKDVPLSLEKNAIPEGHAALLPYIPPHPQRGTPYHRYTMLLFEQTAESTVAEIPREAMDVSAFASAHQLKLAGIHFWREQWTDKTKHTISTIYKDVLKASEPRYGHPGRMDRLKDELGMRQSKYY